MVQINKKEIAGLYIGLIIGYLAATALFGPNIWVQLGVGGLFGYVLGKEVKKN